MDKPFSSDESENDKPILGRNTEVDNAAYRLKTADPGFGLSREDRKELNRYDAAPLLRKDGPSVNNFTKWRSEPSTKQLKRWAAEERQLVRQAQSGDRENFDSAGRRRVI